MRKLFKALSVFMATCSALFVVSAKSNTPDAKSGGSQVVEVPEYCPGSKWRFHITALAGPKQNQVIRDFTDEVIAVSSGRYDLKRTELPSGAVSNFSLNRVPRQDPAAPGLMMGKGHLYNHDFPLVKGKEFTQSESFMFNGSNVETKVTHVVGEAKKLTVAGNEFSAIEIVGKGWWNSSGSSGAIKQVKYYAPNIGATVRLYRETGALDKSNTDLVSFELKADCSVN